MRLAFVSDLHAEYQMEVCGLVARGALASGVDVLILAGDVSPDPEMLHGCLRVLAGGAEHVLFLPGNHDLWSFGPTGQRLDSSRKYRKLLPELSRRAGVEYLGLSPVSIGGFSFCGVTGWYDFSLRNEEVGISLDDYRAGRFRGIECADRRFFEWREEGSVLSDEEVAVWMRRCLEHQLAEASSERKIVVTHFLPGSEPLVPQGQPEQDFVMGFLGDRGLGDVIDGARRVVRLISGHWHVPFLVRRRCATGDYPWEGSPVGYPRERPGSLEERVAQALRIVDV